MLNNQEPIRKMSKLVLPEPQISDQVKIIKCNTSCEYYYIRKNFLGITTSC